MHKLSPAEKYSVKEIAEALKLSTILANGIRIYFGDPISINELKQISRGKFLSCKNFGSKRLREFQNALSILSTNNERAVTMIGAPNIQTIVVEIDLSKSFRDVIKDLHEIMAKI
jgi:hypothetical protein